MSDHDDDLLTFLVADVHKAAAESAEIRRRLEALRARWRQNHTELLNLEKAVGANTLDKVATRRAPLIVRRWPGVYGKPS
jgi:hypothetical protein